MTVQQSAPTHGTPDAPPPPPPPGAQDPPPPPSASDRRTEPRAPIPDGGHGDAGRPLVAGEEPPRRPWRDRLPELIGGIGTILVLAAVVGFLSATWDELDRLGRSLVLLAATGGLSAAAVFVEARRREQLGSLTSMLWLAGAGTLTASATLASMVALPAAPRVAIAIGGGVAAVYGATAWRRATGTPLRQLGVVGPLLFAAGPFGTSVADRYDQEMVWQAFEPLAALLWPDAASAAFAITGTAHLVIGALWLAHAVRSRGTEARIAWVGSTVVLAYAALELHALPYGIGAFGALMIVLAYLVFGMVSERGGVVATGAAGVLVVGARVLWSLFSGEVATTVAAFTVGLALLAWAVRARNEREDEPTG